MKKIQSMLAVEKGGLTARFCALLLGVLFLPSLVETACSQPRLVSKKPAGYQVGDKLDPDTFVEDKDLNRVRLLEAVKPDTRVVVLVIFGGAARPEPGGHSFRGPLWCLDSFDDISVQRALVETFKDQPVEIIGIAVPPVYSTAHEDYGRDVFLGKPDDSPEFQKAARLFIDTTEQQVKNGFLPFPTLYYDLKYRLGLNRSEYMPGPAYGPVSPWVGKLKWYQDPRKYGTPTIWILSGKGEILRPPFFGNDYDSSPPEINYGYKEVREAVEQALTAAEAGH